MGMSDFSGHRDCDRTVVIVRWRMSIGYAFVLCLQLCRLFKMFLFV